MDHYNRIYLSTPHMSGLEQEYIQQAFDSNWIAPLGHHVDQFEQEVSAYVRSKGALAVSSGTAALHLALRLLNVEQGDLVFCSALTFVASANPILYQGAQPVFIDSEPETWNMSPLALEKAFACFEKENKRPKAVIVVNLYGQSADLDQLEEICARYHVPIVEDAAESLGATYKGRMSGTIGKFGIYSFNGNKIITTSGGGMLVSDDEYALKKAHFWATQAKDPALHYQHRELGYNYRMSNILAGIGRAQLRVIEERITARRKVFANYYRKLSGYEGISFMPEASFGRCTRWLTALTVDAKQLNFTATDLIKYLSSKNIESRPVWKPLHLQPLFKGCPFFAHDADVAAHLFHTGICLPSGSNLSLKDQERVIWEIISFINQTKRRPGRC